MTRFKEIIQWQTDSGKQVKVDNITVTPQSWTLAIRWPFGGWVWSRPLAVQVEQGDRLTTTRLSIVDVTRLLQVGLFGLSLIFGMLGLIFLLQHRST